MAPAMPACTHTKDGARPMHCKLHTDGGVVTKTGGPSNAYMCKKVSHGTWVIWNTL